MADGMDRIAKDYPESRGTALSDTRLPLVGRIDLALNVAACDSLPVVVTWADEQQQLDQINQKLLGLAWSEQFAGQFIYASATDGKELKPITGRKQSAAILIVQPDAYGLSGQVLQQLESDASVDNLRTAMHDVIAKYPRRQKTHNSHVRMGIQLGIEWETLIPETDQQSLRAKARARGNR